MEGAGGAAQAIGIDSAAVDPALAVLRSVFGYPDFRGQQREIIEHVIAGGDALVLMPTGGGKSLCFQIPALIRPGLGLVVSPLIALMKDQVDALRARGVAAAFVNSSLSDGERQERQAALRRGDYRLVYVAPERFRSPSFLSAIAGVRVPLLAVDEAHCISAWGHDFRPEYQQLARAREQLRAERVLALTATALSCASSKARCSAVACTSTIFLAPVMTKFMSTSARESSS